MTINADQYQATRQVLEAAVDKSILRNEIITVEAGRSYDRMVDLLLAECEGDAIADRWREFWGTDCDGQGWRVHLVKI